MTKKSLSDLLKEEVNKADTPDPAIAPQAEADEAPAAPKATPSRRASRSGSSRRTAGKTTPAPKAKAEVAAAKPQAKAEVAAAKPEAEAEAPIAPDVDLAQRVSALEKDLATAEKDKAQMEKTIAGLQKDLETQQGRLFELKDSLAQAEAATKTKADALTKTQADLEEAKKTILKLAETPAPAAAPAPATRRISGADITPRRPMEAKDRPTYHRGVPEYTIQTGQPNPMLTDADIGWVD
ncbi:hypothetical protein [Phormidium tenue]|uniref:Uncharacterized protein n=1 Tax=Phormidium tenue NIES-30 TaxID=549789 RepID=A0A1U7J2Z0_9CYAN|nr:hypothetical protein [Phormidium tenue]MBD2233284.1 hypothetical protein [Phormidium tenue FACHB-1052]OKH46545.1 hypothetical protein NIES30_15690 [Phormidium tenue NIES-30]